jgi:hypothetical protein
MFTDFDGWVASDVLLKFVGSWCVLWFISSLVSAMAHRLQVSVEARIFFDVSRGSLIFDTRAFAGGCEICASLISLARWDTFRLHPLSTFLDESIIKNFGEPWPGAHPKFPPSLSATSPMPNSITKHSHRGSWRSQRKSGIAWTLWGVFGTRTWFPIRLKLMVQQDEHRNH